MRYDMWVVISPVWGEGNSYISAATLMRLVLTTLCTAFKPESLMMANK